MAVGAQRVAAIFGEEDADVELIFFALECGEEAADAGIGAAPGTNSTGVPAAEDRGRSKEHRWGWRADLAKRIISPWKGRYLGGSMGRWRPARGFDSVGDDEVEVEVDGVAEALATGTCAEGIVEAEEARLRLAARTMTALALEAALKRWRERPCSALVGTRGVPRR